MPVATSCPILVCWSKNKKKAKQIGKQIVLITASTSFLWEFKFDQIHYYVVLGAFKGQLDIKPEAALQALQDFRRAVSCPCHFV